MNIFLNEFSRFCFEFNFELNNFKARFNEKMKFQIDQPGLSLTNEKLLKSIIFLAGFWSSKLHESS